MLAAIAKVHEAELSQAALVVLKNIAAKDTFQYLQNNSRFLKKSALGANITGTSRRLR